MRAGCCVSDSGARHDLACSPRGRWIWGVSWLLVGVGAIWQALLFWLWIPAFAAAGLACLWNVRRCGRLHCYVTGPLYLLAALYLVGAAADALPFRMEIFLVLVFGTSLLAILAERKLGRYRPATRESPQDRPGRAIEAATDRRSQRGKCQKSEAFSRTSNGSSSVTGNPTEPPSTSGLSGRSWTRSPGARFTTSSPTAGPLMPPEPSSSTSA